MVVGFLAGQMRQSIMFMRQNRFDPSGELVSTNVAEHLAIYDAVMQRDARAAALTMRAHITAAARRLGPDLFRCALERHGELGEVILVGERELDAAGSDAGAIAREVLEGSRDARREVGIDGERARAWPLFRACPLRALLGGPDG